MWKAFWKLNEKIKILVIIFLILILAYILGILVQKTGLENPVEISLLFIGLFATFGGAYLGALIAGKYSLRTVEKQFINERKNNLNKVVVTLSFYNITLFKVFNSIFKQINTCNDKIERDIKNDIPLNVIFEKYIKSGDEYKYTISEHYINYIREYNDLIKDLSPQFSYFIIKGKKNSNFYLNKIFVLSQYIEILYSVIKVSNTNEKYIHIKDSEDLLLKTFKALLEINDEIINVDSNELYKRIYE
ncbi:hypothetical protein [Staphylococcus saprophyticus]|uniref:hypothetical protein n=1 Tax=Staphylococcus saprophyticus TaxID=29385 RepID=UPI00280B0B4D|nr:hypothetical protein [Staphylococcus saprophyticus]WMM15859.1 hypothetical protein RCG45_01690 [Staphylococcus saprophyticus]